MPVVDKPLDFEIINLGNSSPVKLNQLIKILDQVTCKQAKINQLPLQPGDAQVTFADTSKAKRLLGYNPKVNLIKGIKLFFEWFESDKLVS